jgi:lysophospholipase L1-like esterase
LERFSCTGFAPTEQANKKPLIQETLMRLQFRFVLAILLCSMAASWSSTRAQATSPLQYVPLPTPCRAIDTRVSGGPIAGGTSQNFDPAGGGCNIPTPSDGIIAYALNVTVVPHSGLGLLTVWPAGEAQPAVSTLNSYDGRVKANAAIVAGGSGGDISIFSSDTTDVVLDVTGYFTTSAGAQFVPITPCRLVDTRQPEGPLAGPSLTGGEVRTFALAGNNCNLPDALGSGGALSLNITAVPQGGNPVNYVTVWGGVGSADDVPLHSTLNAPTGAVTANAAIVTIPAASSDSISVFTSNATDLVIDINGYFAPAQSNGLSLYPVTPCRLLDTRASTGVFTGELTVPITTGNACNVPGGAQAYVTNATVVPSEPLGFLILWPDATPQPLVSTLNALDGAVTSNMALVSGTHGLVDAFAANPTQLIMDISAYFAPGAPNTPVVEFVGDEISAGLVAASGNTSWYCDDCQQGATSTTALAGLSAVLAKHPDIVHILIGTYDIDQSSWYPGCGAGNITCTNLESMIRQATAAGIKVIVGTIPPWGDGSLATQLSPSGEAAGNQSYWNRTLNEMFVTETSYYPAYFAGVPLVDYDTALAVQVPSQNSPTGFIDGVYQSNFTRNGVDPNAAGYAVMLPLTQQAISTVWSGATP